MFGCPSVLPRTLHIHPVGPGSQLFLGNRSILLYGFCPQNIQRFIIFFLLKPPNFHGQDLIPQSDLEDITIRAGVVLRDRTLAEE